MRTAALCTLLFCTISAAAAAQDHTVSVTDLTLTTQQHSEDMNSLAFAWWIPTEFWIYSAAADPTVTLTDEDVEALRSTLDAYVLVAATDGRLTSFGQQVFHSPADIRASLRLVDLSGDTLSPLLDKEVSQDVRTMLAMFKPAFASFAGPMGTHVEFMLFPARNSKGESTVDPFAEGTFEVLLGEERFSWRLPLGPLLPPKFCPVDGEELSGAWKYCPWHGVELKDQPPAPDDPA